MRVNLAKDNNNSLNINKRYLTIITIFVFIVIALAVHYFILKNEVKTIESQINQAEKKLNILQKERSEYLSLQKKVKNLESKLEEKNKENLNYPDLINQNWNITLKEISEIIPAKVMLTSLNINKKDIAIRGYAANSSLISDFYDELLNSELFNNIQLQKMTNGKNVSYLINGTIKYKKGEN